MDHDPKKVLRWLGEHDETDMADSEEAREVQIGKQILRLVHSSREDPVVCEPHLDEIETLARELVSMHTPKTAEDGP